MALERIGLGAIVKFDGAQAVAGMRRVGGAAKRLGTRVSAAGQTVGGGFQSAGAGIARMGAALLPFTAAFALATKQAAQFEKQMSAVGAITGAGAADMEALTLKAKQMGATTVFSATQSAEAMESLARAGFTTSETIEGLSGVMAAAAADAIPLSSAADIIASNVRAFGLEAGQAARVADVLAKASASTNTNITGLGEALKFAAPVAKTLGVTLPEVTAAIGALADSGIKGTLAGTAVKNALTKLAKPSSKAIGLMKKLGIEIQTTSDGNLNLMGTFANVSEALQGTSSKMDKLAALSEIFGLRGAPALTAIEQAMSRMVQTAEGEMPKMVALQNELNKQFTEGGAASEMAEKRLDNFSGAVTLLKSALEGFAIETAGEFLQGTTSGLKVFTKGLGEVVTVLQLLNAGVDESDPRFSKFGGTVIAIAKGIEEGITIAKDVFNTFFGVIKGVFEKLGGSGEDTVQTIAKIVTVFALVAAAAAPLLIIFGTVLLAIGAVIPLIAAIGAISLKAVAIAIAAFTGFAAIVIGTITAVFSIFREEGESFGETFSRIFDTIKFAINSVIDGAIKPFVKAFKEQVQPQVKAVMFRVELFIEGVRKKFQEVMASVILAVKRLMPVFKLVFRVLGKAVGGFVKGALLLFRAFVVGLGPIITAITAIAKFIIKGIVNSFINFVKLITKVADTLGRGDLIPAELREFIEGGEFTIGDAPTIDAALGREAKEERVPFGEGIEGDVLTTQAAVTGGGAAAPQVDVTVEPAAPGKVSVSSSVSMDGKKVAENMAERQIEINERNGFKTKPFQRRAINVRGFAPQTGRA